MFANVVVDIKSNNVDVIYSYAIPDYLEQYVYVGSRVIVPFATRKVSGYVVGIVEESAYSGDVKSIVEVLDLDKEINDEQIAIANYLAKETKSLMINCLNLMFPSFLKSKYRKFLTIKEYGNLDAEIAFLFGTSRKLAVTPEILQKYPKIKTEIKKGNLELSYDIYAYGKRKYTKLYFYDDSYNLLYEKYQGSSLKKRIIQFVKDYEKGCSTDIIKEHINCSSHIIRSIEKEGFIYSKNELIKTQKEHDEPLRIKKTSFNFDQECLIEKYCTLKGKPFLLFSNDEQFKLDFYLNIAYETILNKQQVLILTPTLLSNFLIARYFKKCFAGANILTFTSDLSHSEFYDNYMDVKWDNCDIAITTKVGAFLPFKKLGLIIIIDEENENYIAEYSPKYHAIEVMKFRAKYHDAKLVLSSSSPSMAAYYNYSRAKYILLPYITKVATNVHLVDMHDEYQYDYIISNQLIESLQRNLDNKHQALLILNVKGYSNHMYCRSCGKVLRCEKCKIPLTYYQEKQELKCNYCGSKKDSLYCECGNACIPLGVGLERVKEHLEKIFPTSSILLLDGDKLQDYEDFQDAMVKIEEQEVDIILGTNNIMAMKNSHVHLIALLSVDSLLNTSDYKASEIVYDLIFEAASTNDSEVVIQGMDVSHYAITYALANQYNKFYEVEIKNRQTFLYPPFIEINSVLIIGEYKEMYHCANYFRKLFRSAFNGECDCLGPTYSSIRKGVRLIVKHNDYDKLSRLIDEVVKRFKDAKLNIIFERYPKSFN